MRDQREEMATGLAEVQWRTVIRRAYGVPDIVGDEAAMTHVAFQLNGLVVGEARPEVLSPIPGMLLDALITLGARGRLDGFLVELPAFNDAQLVAELRDRVGCREDHASLMVNDVITHVKARLAHLASRE